jgi:galactose mutarotase-like enzyme
MQVSGQSPGYDFGRHIALVDNEPRMSIRYSLRNNEEFPLPWYWCAHALIAVEPGMRIELPATQHFLVEDSVGKPNPAERIRRWPDLDLAEDNSVDLSDCFPERGNAFAQKIFVETPEDGAVSVAVPDSAERLTLRFDREQIPWLGLWINNNGWSGCGSEPYLNLGVEPGTVPYDSVATAIENDAIDWIQPAEVRDWSLIVDLAA